MRHSLSECIAAGSRGGEGERGRERGREEKG